MASAAEQSLERLRKRFEAIPQNVKDAVQPALAKSGEELVERMQNLAPVDTGELEASIAFTMPGDTTPPYSQPGGSEIVPENTVRVTAGNERVRYAHLVEYGTAQAHAQPFFWPAFRLTRSRITTRIKRAITKAVKEEWGK